MTISNDTTAFLALGSNLGDRTENLTRAIKELSAHDAISVVRQSSWYASSAWYVTDQPDFFNGVIEVRTRLTCDALLQTVLAIENTLGRQRTIDKGPRTIDIDILLFGSEVHSAEFLVVPHPAMWERPFVLIPLVEIAPNVIDPQTQRTALLRLGELGFSDRLEKVPTLSADNVSPDTDR